MDLEGFETAQQQMNVELTQHQGLVLEKQKNQLVSLHRHESIYSLASIGRRAKR